MKKLFLLLLALSGPCFTLHAQNNLPKDALLDKLAGKWLLTGLIDGKQVKHDISAGWVLGHEYFQIRETSREKDAKGKLDYEAIIYLTFNKAGNEYDCLWLDNTSNAGLSNGIIAHGKKEPNRLALLFKFNETFNFHTTFTYNPEQHTWAWSMISEDKGKKDTFAKAIMRKVKS